MNTMERLNIALYQRVRFGRIENVKPHVRRRWGWMRLINSNKP
jgi:hypothetical protein